MSINFEASEMVVFEEYLDKPKAVEVISLREISRAIKNPPCVEIFGHLRSVAFSARITPRVARDLLGAKNTGNRRINRENKKKLIRAIESEDFMLTGETIIFDRSGNIVDGQHRLEACVESGESIETYVAFGVDPKAFAIVDDGKNRTKADTFEKAGLGGDLATSHDHQVLQGAMIWVDAIATNDGRHTKSRKSNLEGLRDIKNKYGYLPEYVDFGLKVKAKGARTIIRVPAALAAALAYLICERYPDKGREFIEAWISGDARDVGPLQHVERVWTKYGFNNVTTGTIAGRQRAILILMALRLYVRGLKGKLHDFDEVAMCQPANVASGAVREIMEELF
jgi:hypothetical protein